MECPEKFHRYLTYWFSSLQKRATFFPCPGVCRTQTVLSTCAGQTDGRMNSFTDWLPTSNTLSQTLSVQTLKNKTQTNKQIPSQAFLLMQGCRTHKHIIKCKTTNKMPQVFEQKRRGHVRHTVGGKILDSPGAQKGVHLASRKYLIIL